jgi:hypothetical protein
MNKNRKHLSSSFFKKILVVLIASSFSISSSYGRDQLLKTGSVVDFTYGVPQVTWNKDLKQAVINVELIPDAEDQGKEIVPFLFFRFCKKPDEVWLFGTKRGRGYEWVKHQPGEEPRSYSEPSPNNLPPSVSLPFQIYKMTTSPLTTNPPIDISSMRSEENCVELLAGYGLGKTSQEAYDEMLSQQRFNVVFDTRLGPRHRVYHLEVKTISSYNHPPVIEPGICVREFVKGCQ